MSTEIGIDNSVKATPGEICYTGASEGDWTAGEITLVLHKKIAVKQQQAVYKATCNFKFTGSNPKGDPITGSEKLELKAADTKLSGKDGGMLRVESRVEGAFGNELEIIASQSKLATA
ncbi:hypothetical protein FKG94_17885 [Exilibacterium tricleocarpae]|uniref:Uncharacterized protein n=1 Tax=Exilibacterium tricleocarpae TaxID=2591008 RepID=A0A545T5S8_9GAMM|nr:hypothetical protein [Exilibacterium tricleocarpae]TQV72573.1 hypothetical protein FKG94_17885 [Exilibacterium tricleocarpae]